MQVPAEQASFTVQILPSLQRVPSGARGFEQRPLAGLQTPAMWHASEAVQTTGSDPEQMPATQASVRVHGSESLQGVLSGATGFEHRPLAGLQVPARWHASEAVQTTGLEPAHAPPTQVSVRVQASPSLQGVLSGATGFEQRPLAGLQVPARWHASEAAQTTGLEPTHAPPTQVSVCVHGSESLQGVPFGATEFAH